MASIAIYSNRLLPYSETFIREQALALRDWRPVLVGQHLVEGGLPLDGIDVRVLQTAQDPGGRWGHTACRLLGRPHPASLRRLRAAGAALLHAHFGTSAVDVWPLADALGLPMLVTLHGYDITIRREWWESGNGGLQRRLYPRRLLALADQPNVSFIAVSEAIRQRAIDFGIPDRKIAVRYIGIDTARFQPGTTPMAQRPRRVLFIGRLVEKKGLIHLLQAFSQVRRQITDAELMVVGDGPLRPHLEQAARELSIPVEFRGICSSAEIRALLHQARLLCLPSVSASNGDAEGFGMVLLEAQACGVPVVSSALGGAQEGLLDGETGFAFDEGDHLRLAEILSDLLPDDQALQRMSQTAVAFVRSRFDLHALTTRLEADYDRLSLGNESRNQ